MRTVLVSGGVISGIGKGIIASSAGLLLKTTGLRVTAIKIDPYLNIDAGTLGPLEHGECFVLADGGECDLDLGNYERYLGIQLTNESNITTGKIYNLVLQRERKGDFLGKTVQVVPHITDAIQDHIERVSKIPVDDSGLPPDVCIIELGGTVGDIESMPFIEALVQYRHKVGKDNFFCINVTYVPVIHGEEKTKPTQHAIKQVRSAGLTPDLIACRCEHKIEEATLQKIARSCQVDYEQVMTVWDMETIYQVPLILNEQGLLDVLTRGLRLDKLELAPSMVQKGASLWELWKDTVVPKQHLEPINIVLVGKYTALDDSYLSVRKSLEHAAMRCNRKLNLVSVDSEHLEDSTQKSDPTKYHKAWNAICEAQGMVVPGGFGSRGVEGMIRAAQWARERKIPYIGLCLGMQVAVIEAARNLCGLTDATSEEFDANAEHDVIIFMPEGSKEQLGGTMRLGTRATHFEAGSEWSKLRALYKGAPVAHERHRHRYEVNPDYVEQLEAAGLNFIGKDDTGRRMEVVERKDHPYFVGLQAHPEYTSRVLQPAPSLLGFVAASAGCLDKIIDDLRHHKTPEDGVNGVTHF
ncbi:CTP synthase [Talaromyces proteolyticus]|uniref:CTP synthase n=1 Tax=Talaromyces proteolyticus TaxID=1131652 RepID=A0AAD4KGZ2_9EURO|nr:CTP synthase [Talaromyces proteolyticus]KAH8690890.1 CTP synthase [Talaromyces proteolyticus]